MAVFPCIVCGFGGTKLLDVFTVIRLVYQTRMKKKAIISAKNIVLGRLVLQTSLKIFLSVKFGQFLGLDGPYLALLGPLLASFNCLGLQESGLDPAETNFRRKTFSRFLIFWGRLFTS